MSQKIGLSREAFQEWDYIMSQNGMSVDQLQTGFKTLVTQIDQAAQGSGKGAEAFEKLGVSVTDASGKVKSQEQVFSEAVTALQGMEDGTEKARLANQLFGRSGSELMPLLNGAAGSVDELRQRAHELGIVMSDDAVDAGVKFTDTMDNLKRSFGAVFTQVGVELMPMFQGLADWIIEHMPQIREITSKAFEVIGKAVSFVYGVFRDYFMPVLAVLFGWVQDNMPTIEKVFGSVFGFIGEIVSRVWGIFKNNLIPVLEALWNFISPTFPLIEGVVKFTFGAIERSVEAVVFVFERVTNAIKTAVEWLGSWNKMDKTSASNTKSSLDGLRDGSHASGLPFVPYDGYRAELHRGETVWSANSSQDFAATIINGIAALMGSQQGGGGTMNVNLNVDGRTLANVLIDPLKDTARQRGVSLA